jgi:hypothetical protein
MWADLDPSSTPTPPVLTYGWNVPAGPTISVEKVTLFCNPASGARSQALQSRLYIGEKFAVAKAKVFPHLEAWEHRIQRKE